MNNNKGYTLIELLAVTVILIVISSSAALMIMFVLRSSTKARVASIISQNGNYALTVLSTTITNAFRITHVGSTALSPVNNCSASPSGSSIQLETFDNQTILISCSVTDLTITYGAQPARKLVDTQHAEFVPISGSACRITCTQEIGAPPVVSVRFSLRQAGSTNFIEQQYEASEFKTSVSFRNYLAE